MLSMLIYAYEMKREVVTMTELNELDSICGITDDELTERFKEAIRIDNEIKKIKGVPIAGYDTEKTGIFRISGWKEKVCFRIMKNFRKLLCLPDQMEVENLQLSKWQK